MRHLKRFKNWLVLIYYAGWTFSQQFHSKGDQPGSDELTANRVITGDGSKEPVSSLAEPSNQRSEATEPSTPAPHIQQARALEVVETVVERTPVDDSAVVPTSEVKQTINPAQKVTTASQQPVADPASPVNGGKPKGPQASPAVSANGKAQERSSIVTEPQAAAGKYQPGAINDQTAQRLARLLVSEIKLYYNSKTDGENSSDVQNIYDMLKDPIDQSRRHYKQRMGENAIKSMPDYFHGELVRSLCGGDASRLGPNYPTLDESA